jgi:hypothetical protein
VLLGKARITATLKWTSTAITKNCENTWDNDKWNTHALSASKQYYDGIYTIINTLQFCNNICSFHTHTQSVQLNTFKQRLLKVKFSCLFHIMNTQISIHNQGCLKIIKYPSAAETDVSASILCNFKTHKGNATHIKSISHNCHKTLVCLVQWPSSSEWKKFYIYLKACVF